MKNVLIGVVVVAAVIVLAWSLTKSTTARKPPAAAPTEQAAPPPVEPPTDEAPAPPERPSPAPAKAAPPVAPPVAPPPPAVEADTPAAPANTGRTVLADRRDDYLYQCGKCNKLFTPTDASAKAQGRFQWSDPIDCPLCDAHGAAYYAQTCPSCRLAYPLKANSKPDARGVVCVTCPRCGIDPTEWVQNIRRARTTSPAEPGLTVQGDRRDDYVFLCRKCKANFSPTLDSARTQMRDMGAKAIDCPLCYARQSADSAVCCPKCKHVFLHTGGRGAVCPHCKTDPVEWYRKKAESK